MKMHPSAASSVLFKAVLAWVLLFFAGLSLQANYAPVITQGAGPLTLTYDWTESASNKLP